MTATDEFTLTLQETCLNNKLKLDGTLAFSSSGTYIGDLEYKITTSSSALTLTPLYSSSLNPLSCPLTAVLYIWDSTKNIWVD